jgi:predicted O-methyltransferase YrrM
VTPTPSDGYNLSMQSRAEWSTRISALVGADTRYDDVDRELPASSSAWPIDRDMAGVLARLVIELRLTRILEFGAGTSSIVFANALRRIGGGFLTSVEEDPRWSANLWARARAVPTVDGQMIVSRVYFRASRRGGLYHAYDDAAAAEVAQRGPFTLVLIDGPDGYIGRDGALHLAFSSLAPGALVVVDDAKRRKERDTMARWFATYPGLVPLADAPALGHGTAVLGYTGDPTVHLSPQAIASSAVREAYAWVRGLTNPPPVPPTTSALS